MKTVLLKTLQCVFFFFFLADYVVKEGRSEVVNFVSAHVCMRPVKKLKQLCYTLRGASKIAMEVLSNELMEKLRITLHNESEKKPRKKQNVAPSAPLKESRVLDAVEPTAKKPKAVRKLFVEEDLTPYQLITLTAGDCAENHARMEQIGVKRAAGQGFTVAELDAIRMKMELLGASCELVNLSTEESEHPKEAAAVLVIRNGVNVLLGSATGHREMFDEQMQLTFDTKALMRGRVVNKHARHNLCYDNEGRDADYEAGKGTIVGYKDVPLMRQLMMKYEEVFGEKAAEIKMESNLYYDVRTTGIGFHGDTERVLVIAARIGYASLPMHFQWFYKSEPVGTRMVIPLSPGDVYIMSEKAVGSDWMKKNTMTLRHATGCEKYTGIKSE